MPIQFLDTIESIRAEAADTHKLFGDAGKSVRSAKKGAAYRSKLAEAAKLIADVYNGVRKPYVLQEAMTTSDFPILFADILDRQLLAYYRETPSSWREYVRRRVVNDFRTVKRFALNGGAAVLGNVPQSTEYPETSLSDAAYSYAVAKYGRRIPLSWEAIVNDDLGAFAEIPQILGQAARRTEEKFATQLFAGASGPHTSLYSVGNANIITGNPALSIAGLQSGLTTLMTQTDTDGEPIMITTAKLVVPPQLVVTAQNIVNATQVWFNENGGTTNQRLITNSWAKDIVTVVPNYYLPIVSSTANGATSWYLFADPNQGRPALEMGFLRGHEEPEVFVRATDAIRVGGGESAPMDGDFDTDSTDYKVRHVLGGTRMDPKSTVASNGSGS